MNKDIRFTRFEIARIIGARALQIAMGAPLLMDLKERDFKKLKYSPIEISKLEFKEGILPITIKRPLPRKAK